MPVIGNSLTLSTHKNLKRVSDRLETSRRKLSSGRRIDRASDGAAELAQAERLRAQITSLTRSSQNVQDGVSLTQVADAGLSRIAELAGRVKELAVQAGNGTLSAEDKQILQDETEQVLADIDQIAASTDFNGKDLLSGAEGATEIDTGDGSSVAVDLGDASSSALGFSSLDLTVDASAAIDRADAAISAVASRRAQLGATENRLHSAGSQLDRQVIELTGAESRIRDVDVAREASRLIQHRIGVDAALAVHAQASLQPRVVLGLLAAK